VLDVGARHISDGMAIAAANALAALGREQGLAEARILPDIADPLTAVRVAVAVGEAAHAEGLATLPPLPDPAAAALEQIMRARRATEALMAAGLV
jgi:malic enzyme